MAAKPKRRRTENRSGSLKERLLRRVKRAKERRPYFAVRKSKRVTRGWYVCIVAKNGNEILTSRVYANKSNAVRACSDASGARGIRIEA